MELVSSSHRLVLYFIVQTFIAFQAFQPQKTTPVVAASNDNTIQLQAKLNSQSLIIINSIMSFLNLSDLIKRVADHQLAQHQIKGKRIKKELDLLMQYQNQQLTFKKYQLYPYGLSFYVETQFQHRMFDFQVIIDSQYPFNSPQVFYQHESSSLAFGQNLLSSLLQGGKWGPSLLLSSIFDKLNDLAKYLYEEKESIVAYYHLDYIYEQDLLDRYNIELFKIDEFTWKFMLKSTAKKVIGLTKETFLKFVQEGGKLKLQQIIKIKDIKEANASIQSSKFKLDIVSIEDTVKTKFYFGGDEGDLQKILYFMNPIQTLQKRLSKEKQNYKPEELQKTIKQYSDLIEYYSLRDEEKTKTYLNKIQSLIKTNYQHESKQEKKIQKMSEEIQT